MTHRERIETAIRREKPDHVPIALWRHFPKMDESAEGLAKAVIDFQKRFDFDLVKVTPASGYPAEAWGAELVNRQNNSEGTREYLKRVIASAEEWHALPPLDVLLGVWARELKALQLVRAGVGADIHLLQTIFSPLTIAKQLAGDLMLQHMRSDPEDFKKGLRVISETTARFALECLWHGADGIFFATQFASRDLLSVDEYKEFGIEFDLPIFEVIGDDSKLNLLHLHGTNPMFEILNAYPVHIVNWHDRGTSPSLADGQKLFHNGAVLGGLHRIETFAQGSPEEVQAEVRDAIAQTSGQGVIIGAGCVSLVTTPDLNVQAAIREVRSS